MPCSRTSTCSRLPNAPAWICTRCPSSSGSSTRPSARSFPDLTFPALQDSDRTSIREANNFYEVAYRRYADPAYLVLLEPRGGNWALFWGADIDADKLGGAPPLATSNSVSEGLAILRDNARGLALYLDYGAGHSGHVHPAKLGMILYADGDERFVDPGRLPYGNPLHAAWYLQTVAHNTVVVDGQSQKRCPARLRAFATGDDFALVRADTDGAYPGVTFDRTLLLRDGLIFDVFQCRADAEKTFDLPLHVRGKIYQPRDAVSCDPLGYKNGYQHLTKPMTTKTGAFVFYTAEGRAIRIAAHEAASERFFADGMGATPREVVPTVLRRIRGNQALFISTYELLPETELTEIPPPQPAISVEDGTVTLSLDDTELRLGEKTTSLAIAGVEREAKPEGDPAQGL